MELDEIINARRMCRNFKPDSVDPSKVRQALDISYFAPSAGKTRAHRFLVLDKKESLKKFWDITADREFLRSEQGKKITNAPIVAIVFTSKELYRLKYLNKKGSRLRGVDLENWPVPFWWVDAGMAIMLSLLKLEELGLGSLFFWFRDENDELSKVFSVPKELIAVGALAIGHPNGTKTKKHPKIFAPIYNSWSTIDGSSL